MRDTKTCGQGPCRHNASMDPKDRAIQESLSRIKHRFLVMSGKGGVGKTSVAVNLAITLSRNGAKVGLMDVDLHGPDVPRMLGLKGLLDIAPDKRILPKTCSENLAVVSMESLSEDPDQALIWRGPLKMQVIRQFISDVHWGRLDYLIVDAPPGTGDEPLSVAQTVPGAEAIIVTTPQEIALADIRKSIRFCTTVKMPIFGLVENMSGFVCPHCGESTDLFRAGGGYRTALAMDVPFLGRIPFDPQMVACADTGKSYVDAYPDSKITEAYAKIVATILKSRPIATSVKASDSVKEEEREGVSAT